jgi:toxin HigB-1
MGLETLFRTGRARGLDAQLAAKLQRILMRLNDGPLPEAMALPGHRLHPLQGDRKGSWSVSVSGNFRVTFKIEGVDATDVDFTSPKGCYGDVQPAPSRARSFVRTASIPSTFR